MLLRVLSILIFVSLTACVATPVTTTTAEEQSLGVAPEVAVSAEETASNTTEEASTDSAANEANATIEQQAPAAVNETQTNGAKAANFAQECSKAYAAKKTCERLVVPGDIFGIAQKTCLKQAKKKFGGLGCKVAGIPVF